MRIRRRFLMWAGSAALAGILGWMTLREPPLEVEIGTVRRGTLQVTVDAEGKTRVRDRYTVTAPVTGRLERIDLPEGTPVRAGDVVARIAPVPLDAQAVRQATARVAAAQSLTRDAETRVRQARATLEQERRAAGRIDRLVRAGALAERDLEEAQLTVRLREEDLAAAEARARAAAADVDQARAALIALGGGQLNTRVLVRAPADGCVLRVPERSDRVVAAGTPIVEVGDPAALELVVDVLSSDASRVRPGAIAMIDSWGEGESLTGRVRRVEPAAFTRVSALGVEEQRVNIVVDLPHLPAGLSDGYRVETRIGVWEGRDVTIVPVSALFRQEQDWAVFRVRDGRATLARVRIGEQNATGAQVLDGLRAGDEVVLFPSDQIENGRRVTRAR
ncbi:MAG TPA: HlyD family efflux transporter periplasmic adaptor subunit [Gemmatimonadaceae bacterium]|nr:HlyD family efflux transporter periplasmic adaptor subunit [Gemmatimonadaceae bacterium]